MYRIACEISILLHFLLLFAYVWKRFACFSFQLELTFDESIETNIRWLCSGNADHLIAHSAAVCELSEAADMLLVLVSFAADEAPFCEAFVSLAMIKVMVLVASKTK
jgi:hypothetical protein